MLSYISLSFFISEEEADRFSETLLNAGALSVSLEDADAGTEHEHAIYDEPDVPVGGLWPSCRITGLLAANANVKSIMETLDRERGSRPKLHYQVETVDDEDWVRRSQAQFQPLQVSERLWITPSWHAAPENACLNLWLDPGLAFGTGSHPTTRLCLQWLDRSLTPKSTVLDYGCGSGILSIAARLFGASQVIGADVDPQAVQSSAENARRNGLNDLVFYTTDQPLPYTFDVVIANILTNPLRALARLLTRYTNPGGRLILSGVLVEQVPLLYEAYAACFTLTVVDQAEGWACLTGVKLKGYNS